MKIDFDKLLELADAASCIGPDWVQDYSGHPAVLASDMMGSVLVLTSQSSDVVEFCAAANPAVVAELVRRLKAAEQDAARYQFLRGRLEGAAFGDDDDEDASITFAVPISTVMSASCDDTIDSAMAAALAGSTA